jgi:hypothetical protein
MFARRIRARAFRKLGELLESYDARGKSRGGNTFTLSHQKAAANAGISRAKALTAVRIRAVPEEEFEELIESPLVPGTTILATVARINRVPEDRLDGISTIDFDEISRLGLAKDAIQTLLRFKRSAARLDTSAVAEMLAKCDDDDVFSLPSRKPTGLIAS